MFGLASSRRWPKTGSDLEDGPRRGYSSGHVASRGLVRAPLPPARDRDRARSPGRQARGGPGLLVARRAGGHRDAASGSPLGTSRARRSCPASASRSRSSSPRLAYAPEELEVARLAILSTSRPSSRASRVCRSWPSRPEPTRTGPAWPGRGTHPASAHPRSTSPEARRVHAEPHQRHERRGALQSTQGATQGRQRPHGRGCADEHHPRLPGGRGRQPHA
jgi:hypothetical protein